MDGVDLAEGLTGSVLIIGFGRFGQVVSQSLLARGFNVSIIDTDTEMIRSATTFGFKVYYGDGTRLDVLRASGAAEAGLIAICLDDRRSADRIVEIARIAFPLAQLLVRSYDRAHSLTLVKAGVGWQIRETFESAMAFGEEALKRLGVADEQAAEIAADIRRRDADRFALEMAGTAAVEAASLMIGNLARPTPFTPPKRARTVAVPEALPVEDLPNYDSG